MPSSTLSTSIVALSVSISASTSPGLTCRLPSPAIWRACPPPWSARRASELGMGVFMELIGARMEALCMTRGRPSTLTERVVDMRTRRRRRMSTKAQPPSMPACPPDASRTRANSAIELRPALGMHRTSAPAPSTWQLRCRSRARRLRLRIVGGEIGRLGDDGAHLGVDLLELVFARPFAVPGCGCAPARSGRARPASSRLRPCCGISPGRTSSGRDSDRSCISRMYGPLPSRARCHGLVAGGLDRAHIHAVDLLAREC